MNQQQKASLLCVLMWLILALLAIIPAAYFILRDVPQSSHLRPTSITQPSHESNNESAQPSEEEGCD